MRSIYQRDKAQPEEHLPAKRCKLEIGYRSSGFFTCMMGFFSCPDAEFSGSSGFAFVDIFFRRAPKQCQEEKMRSAKNGEGCSMCKSMFVSVWIINSTNCAINSQDELSKILCIYKN